MSVEMTAGVLVARTMEGMKFVLGPTMAFRRETMRRMGGFKVTADYCADDFVLGKETCKLGQTVALSQHAIDHMVINSKFWRFDEAPGAVDEVDALFAAEGALWDGAYVQRAVWPAGLCGRRLGWGICGGERGCWRGAWRRGWRWQWRWGGWWWRTKLVGAAGALSGAGFDGVWLLGGELLGPADFVAGAGV